MAATIEATATARRQGSARAVAVVSTAHFASHFYMLLLPPLFPLLREVYGVGYTELGFAISVFSIVTACAQAPVGFVVDRFGARRILVGSLQLPRHWRWSVVRAEVSVKERYFDVLARRRGVEDGPGGGRKRLGEETSRRIGAIRQKCPEDFGTLALRIEGGLSR